MFNTENFKMVEGRLRTEDMKQTERNERKRQINQELVKLIDTDQFIFIGTGEKGVIYFDTTSESIIEVDAVIKKVDFDFEDSILAFEEKEEKRKEREAKRKEKQEKQAKEKAKKEKAKEE